MPEIVQDVNSPAIAKAVTAALGAGVVPVAITPSPAGLSPVIAPSVEDLLRRLVNEMRQLRWVVCAAANQPFLDNPDLPPYGS